MSLTQAHRRDLAKLTGLADRDLALMWRQFDTATDARDGLLELLPELVSVYGIAAATLGADWYDDMRDAAAVKGRFRAIPTELPDLGRTDSLARWAVTPLFQSEPDFDTSLMKVAGGLQHIIATADRETVRYSSIQDPKAKGWMRVGNGGCDWCAQYLDGEVHYVEGYDFNAHDHCRCTASPVFG